MTKNIHQQPLTNLSAPIVKLNAAESKEFGRVLQLLNAIEDYTQICIRDSHINQPLTDTGIFIKADLTNLIGANINMSILLRNEEIKTIKKVMKFGPSFITYDQENKLYNIITEHQEESLNAIDVDGISISPAPVFDDSNYIGLEVPVANLDDVKNYIGKTNFAMLLVYKDQLEQAKVINRTEPYTFKKAGVGSLTGKIPDRILVCQSFLKIAEKKTSLRLAQSGTKMWIITNTKLSSKVDNVTIYQSIVNL